MLTRLRTDTTSVWRRGWAKIGVGVLAGAALGGGVVYADGGDPAQVHACVNSSDEGRPNVIIVDPSDGCPSGYSPRHWAVQGPQGEQGPRGLSAQETPLTTNPSEFDDFVTGVARSTLRAGVTTKPKEVTETSNLDGVDGKVVSAKCPRSHPRPVGGTFQALAIGSAVLGPAPAPAGGEVPQIPLLPISVNPVYSGPFRQRGRPVGWRVAAWVGGDIQWSLAVTAFCRK